MTERPECAAEGVWPENVENIRKLEACDLHHFRLERREAAPGSEKVRSVFRCEVCGGRVRSQARHWYVRGLLHAGRRP